MQSSKRSFLESLTNVTAGLILSFTIQFIYYRAMKIEVEIIENVILTFIFLVVSLFRTYIIRRIFNKH